MPTPGFLLGPLCAVIEAQMEATKGTIAFIQSFGLGNVGVVQTVQMFYSQTDSSGVSVDRVLSVPLLAIIPIPNLEVTPSLTYITQYSAPFSFR